MPKKNDFDHQGGITRTYFNFTLRIMVSFVVIPAEAGIEYFQAFLDARSLPSWGQALRA